jgi:uncharacterized protein YjdB
MFMKKLLSLTVFALLISISSFALGPITGPHGVCIGSTIALSDSTDPGGVWTSSNIAIATVGSSTGYVTGVSAGVVTITYTLGTFVTYSVTVSPAPAAIVGATSFCMGSTTTLSDATPGGTWSSSNPSVATINTLTGVATGVSPGTVLFSYTMGGGCAASQWDTVITTATVDSILGSSSVCVGSTITLTDATPGGTWTSSTPAVATISGGVVTGVSAGYTIIDYTVTTGCGSATASRYISVTSGTPTVDTITGAYSVNVGATTTLYDMTSGGSWTSSNTAIATVGVGTGIVTGVAVGSCTITYTVTSCGGTAYTTHPMTVTTLNRISGHVNFSGAPIDSLGTVKVWLIKYNPTTLLLEAVDSVSMSAMGTSIYYQFLGQPSDSFRIKGAFYPYIFTGTGYIPTYHTSAYYWHDANVLWHTITADDGNDINMAYGTTTSGPGFISGDVTTGANKGTAGGGPAVGLLIYARNASGNVIQQAYTDATGHYSFTNLPVGNYTVYPEAINYATTPYPTITLTTANPGMTIGNFVQHTISHRITPVTAGIQNVVAESSVVAFPNPTTGKLNIQWELNATEKGTVTISDITGRDIYSSNLNMTQGTGSYQVDLSSLTDGLYMISVKGESINYNNKIQVRH